MTFQFTFKQMNASKFLIDYAEQKFASEIKKFAQKPVHAHITFLKERKEHTILFLLRGGKKMYLTLEETSEDMYRTVDLLLEKVSRALRHRKEKLKNHKKFEVKQVIRTASGFFTKGATKNKVVEEDSIDAVDVLKFESKRRERILEPVTAG